LGQPAGGRLLLNWSSKCRQ